MENGGNCSPHGLLKNSDHLIDLRGLRILEQLLPMMQRGEWKITSASFEISLLNVNFFLESKKLHVI
jgi:hypothetical protein